MVQYEKYFLKEMSDEELEKVINDNPSWDLDMLHELCFRAGMIEEWRQAEDNFEAVAYEAAKRLGISI